MTTLTADLTKKFLGLSGEDWEWWTKKIDEIIHTASNGSWLGSYAALKPINVDRTREMIQLAVHGKSKALHYVSTVGVFVSSQRQQEGPYQEEEPLPPVCTKDPPLTQTKIIGEKLVTEASKGGLQFVIYRPEPVSWLGREKGARESFYSHLFLGGIAQLSFLPSTGNCPDWLPVESAAKFLVKIRHKHHAVGKTFHLTNPHPFLSMEKLGNMLVNLGIPMKFISKKKFEAKLVSLPQSNPLKPVLAAANVKDILSEPVHKDFFNTCQLIPDLSEIVPEINHRHIFFAL